MKYNDLIKVNENFQFSVNLQFDINNINKIKEYIPTKDACEVIKFYLQNVLGSKNRASTLIGPYGKGKSHLLLVMISLLSNYESEDEKIINTFLEKIKLVDEETFNLLNEVRNKKIKLLPIIINSNYDDLNQAFLLGLSEAIERNKIDNIILNTYYDIALNVIDGWESEYKEVLGELSKCLKKSNCTLEDLKLGLNSYSKQYYSIFKDVYKCISRGQEFKPLVNTDIVKTYKDITHELAEQGYDGMFIVFDEFSKFLESCTENHIMKDMKLLQDFAELATRTGNTEQIHLCCITHKAINEYSKNIDEEKINSFKTVEGRFKSVYFNSSMDQNYEIVSYALKKTSEFNNFYNEYYDKNKDKYNEIKDLVVFKNTDNIEKNLFKGCFPLNPLTVYSLIELSEKIAQNERTLFTFLTDDDGNSLKSFILNNEEGLFTVDKIYDYFSSLLRKESDEYIKGIWLKAENALRKNMSNLSKKIIKSTAVIQMINDFEVLPASEEIIRLCLSTSNKDFEKSINELIELSIIRKKKITEELDFTTMYNRKLTKEIKDLVETKFAVIEEKDVLNSIVGNNYIIPRKYNEIYKMTRYFINIYMTEEEIINLSNFDLLFDGNSYDGIVITLIRNSKNIDNILEHFSKISDDRVVLKISKLMFSKKFSNLLKEYQAINYMIVQSGDTSDIGVELDMMREETIEAVKDAMKEYTGEDNVLEYVYMSEHIKKVKYISTLLSEICEKIYDKTPIVNNELVNKNELSAPIKKARQIVIDSVLNDDKDMIKSQTSAEATIYKAIVEKVDRESISNVITVIKHFIQSSDNSRKSFIELYKILENKPYSIRKGIIPILIAISLKDYSDNVILYYMNREIEFNSENLIKINDNPDKYFIYTEKGTTEKIKFINDLAEIFDIELESDILRNNVQIVSDTLKRWILSFPRIIRESTTDGTYEIDPRYINIKNNLLRPDLNNNEFIFNTINEIFETKDYDNSCEEITKMKKYFETFLISYKEDIIEKTKDVLDKKYKGSLSTLLKEWYEVNQEKIIKSVFDIKTKTLMDYIENMNTHDDNEIINKICKYVTGFYIEDWKVNDIENYLNELKGIKQKVETTTIKTDEIQTITLTSGDKKVEKTISSDIEISALGSTMKNNIEEIIEEYGNSLNEEEKINILLDIIKKIM